MANPARIIRAATPANFRRDTFLIMGVFRKQFNEEVLYVPFKRLPVKIRFLPAVEDVPIQFFNRSVCLSD
jgi:hypothetical protein